MTLETRLQEILKRAVEAGKLPAALFSFPLELEHPKSEAHGDWSTSLALRAAKAAAQAPRDLAARMVEVFSECRDTVLKVEIAGPGFINLWLKPSYWLSALIQAFQKGDAHGRSAFGAGKRALVEFVSANPTGPLHIGHGRGAVVGDTMASVLSWAGFSVEREYYLNDGGVQMNMLGRSLSARYGELAGEPNSFPEDGYRGDYIRDMAKAYREAGLFADLSPEARVLEMGNRGGDDILAGIVDDLAKIGVRFDHFFSESTLYERGDLARALDDLKSRGLLYEQDGALWFKSAQFGDDKDRVLRKREGSYTYFAPDIAYHAEKLRRGYHLIVNVWGADHGGYVPRMEAALTALGAPKGIMKVLLIQMVQLMAGSERLNMSTRAGEFETLRAVIDEVGPDVTRYFFLLRSHQAQLDFDLDLARKHSAENPVYYIQYAHARICSIFKKAGLSLEAFRENSRGVDPHAEGVLLLPEEIALAKRVLNFETEIVTAAQQFEPHRLAFYLLDLARAFQQYYAGARSDKRYQVLQEDPALRAQKLAIIGAVGQTLRNGLSVLGIGAPEEM